MGLFDLFKKKKKPATESTFPENELEKSLMNAVSDASARKGFYMKLLWNELYVLSSDRKEQPQGTFIAQENTSLDIVTFETGEIPVFTSTNRIFDKGVIKEQVSFVAMKGQDLFRTTKGATLILNPYSPYGKELLPHEIESLLDGSIFEQNSEIEVKEDTQVRIGQPAIYPTELVNALVEFFKQTEQVQAAYLALMQTEKERQPHLVIGLDIQGDMRNVTKFAGPIAEKYLKNEIIDFFKIDEGGISDYFLEEATPFYTKS